MGVWNDFVMRVSIPALLVLNVLTLHFLFVHKKPPDLRKTCENPGNPYAFHRKHHLPFMECIDR